MTEITSLTNPKIKALLKVKKAPDATILIEGLHLIEMAHEVGLVIEHITTTSSPFSQDATLISRHIAEKLSEKKTTDGHFALIKKPEFPLLANRPLLYLDDVSDPGNMGTLLRSALAFGFGGVIRSRSSVNFYNAKVLSAGQGAHFKIPHFDGDSTTLSQLQKDGYRVLVSDVSGGELIEKVVTPKSIIVLGNEARGVSNQIQTLADNLIHLPMANIESLNVAIAGAIMMYLTSVTIKATF